MIWVAAIVLICNVGGAALMAKYGLPSVVPLLGRKESDDSVMGIVGLVLFVTSKRFFQAALVQLLPPLVAIVATFVLR